MKGRTKAQHRFRRRVGRYLAFRRGGFPALQAWKFAGSNMGICLNLAVYPRAGIFP
ncbi:hypothetical protein OpiT1DRAFT_01225 [Opitutaceae bacterium TAV1]|nr:hypothetical protein OpiT1DRAFT_01225 [Opitutaceae bacterium TAV1]